MIYLRLFYHFFKTGLFTVGGGLATLPFLYEMSDTTHWFTHGDIADMIAISESTPGAIGINMSTYAGYITGGILGGFVGTIGLAAPSVIIILIISRFLNKFRSNPYVDKAFYGLRAASIAMITSAGLNVARIALFDLDAFGQTGSLMDLFVWKALLLAAAIYLFMKRFKTHPIVVLAASAVIGILFRFGGA